MRGCFIEFKLDHFNCEFKTPLKIQGMELHKKPGVYLTLTDDLGRHGIGELSNLPGFHSGSFEEDLEQINFLIEKIIDSPFQIPHFDKSKPLFNLFSIAEFSTMNSTVKFALESALLDWYSNRSPEFFEKKIGFYPRRLKPKMNALYVPGEESRSIESMSQQWIKNKVSTIKVKLGRQSIEKDIQTIKEIQKYGQGNFRLRLDANRSFNLDQVNQICSQIRPKWVEYFEEPLESYPDYFSYDWPAEYKLAIDESLIKMLEDDQYPEHLVAWVIKPTTLGLSHTFRLVDQANMLKYYAVISSTYESSYGLKLLKILANFQNRIAETPCGLDTLRYLK